MKRIKIEVIKYPSSIGAPTYRIIKMVNAASVVCGRFTYVVGCHVEEKNIDELARDKHWDCVINLSRE